MNIIEKTLVWFLMFSKRLFHRPSFIILLIIIPIIIPLTNFALSSGDSGVLEIAVCTQDDNQAALSAKEFLLKSDSIITFLDFESTDAAVEALKEHQINAVWVMKSDLDTKINAFVSGKTIEPFIEVIEREDTILLQLSREMLYGAVFEEVSYHLYKNHIYDNFVTKQQVSEAEARSYYDNMERNNKVIELKNLNSDNNVERTNYLTAPIRGILSLILVFAAFAASMYFLKDQSEGKYDWISPIKRIVPAWASCLSASLFSGIAIFIALCFTSISQGILKESLSMLLFIIAVSGFCLNFCVVFKSYGKLGAMLPGIMMGMLALSPIFFNPSILHTLRLLLPTHYYLYSLYNDTYYIYFIIYCICTFFVAALLNRILNNN